jgi:hypothetical protein
MVLPKKFLRGFSTFMALALLLCTSGFARTYQWENYSEPFKEEMRVSTSLDIIVNLPGPLLEHVDALKLTIEHTGIGNDGSGVLRGILMRKSSTWIHFMKRSAGESY